MRTQDHSDKGYPLPEEAVLIALPTCTLGIRHDTPEHIGEIYFAPPGSLLQKPCLPLAEQFIEEISRYLIDPHYDLHLPLAARGTAFQQQVWQKIRAIQPGRTRHYGELAGELTSAARAVGQACAANPFPLVTPCHRVLGKTGLVGFAHAKGGWLVETKRWLLQHEGVF
jgi:methylated-DNA-[protein]-cysteine S-methyltransferase